MMTKTQKKTLYRKAFDKWGMNAQFGMLIEECAELIKASNKYMRKQSKDNVDSLVEGMANVEIMIDQFRNVLSWEILDIKVNEAKESKLERLNELLQK